MKYWGINLVWGKRKFQEMTMNMRLLQNGPNHEFKEYEDPKSKFSNKEEATYIALIRCHTTREESVKKNDLGNKLNENETLGIKS